MGMFINTVPARIKIEDNLDFSTFVSQIATNFTSIYRHQKYSYQNILEDIRKENSKVPNLYQVLLSYQITKIKTDDDIKYSSEWSFNGSISDDFDIHLFDLNDSGSINIAYDYKISKYTDLDIRQIHSRILYIISQILKNPKINLKDILITTPKELKAILALSEKMIVLILLIKQFLNYLKNKYN